jgi:hypothetical protein
MKVKWQVAEASDDRRREGHPTRIVLAHVFKREALWASALRI